MYFSIRQEKIDELKEGRTLSYIAKITKYSRQYITYIFKGQMQINAATVIKLIKPLTEESLKLNNMLNEKGIGYMIEYFFKEEK